MPLPELTLLAFAAAGLASGPHCALMCGPLQALRLNTLPRPSRGLLLIHAGRIAGYALLGSIAAVGGLLLFRQLPPQVGGLGLQLLAALVLLVMGLRQLMGHSTGCCPPKLPAAPTPRSDAALFAQGLLWAAMPCTALYAMLFIAMLSASPLYAALLMAAFGLGTLPLLGASGLLLRRAGVTPGRLRRIGGSALVFCAVATLSAATFASGSEALGWCVAAVR
jgi:sulfite exporter TauE/SafE